MTDQEKNEVLARWCGFTDGHRVVDPSGDDYFRWKDPDGLSCHKHPNFLHSLDALDKWCFPKLHAIDLERMFLSWVWMEERPRPPLAHHCAEAILSLIGEEV